MIFKGVIIAITLIILIVIYPGFGFKRKAWAEGN